MPPLVEVVLSDEDREVLERWARRPRSAQALALRCRIVLAAAEGESEQRRSPRGWAATNRRSATGAGASLAGGWMGCTTSRGLANRARSATRTIERVIVKTLEESPPNATHWSTRSMAAATGMSQTAVSRIWRAFGLKPHQTEVFKLSPDPQFIDKVRDIVGLYLNPPDAAVVLCVDEKSQIQALDRSAPILPLMPGVPERHTHDYVRNGTTNLYAALDLASGQVIADMTSPPSRRGVPPLLEPDRRLGSRAPRRPCRARQLLHAQDPLDPALAPSPPTLHDALHAHLQLLAEPRRALVRRAHHQMDQTLSATAPSATSSHRSEPGSPTGTKTPSPTSGTRPAEEILDSLANYCQRINDSGD